MSGTDIRPGGICLWNCYAMSGTELAYGTVPGDREMLEQALVGSYAFAMPYSVLTKPMPCPVLTQPVQCLAVAKIGCETAPLEDVRY
eukprot:2427048-Rhodomonas_salina.1